MRTTRGFEMYGRRRAEQKKTGPESSSSSDAFLSMITLGTFLLVSLVGCAKKEEAPKPGPPEVQVTEVVQQDVPLYQEWVAQLNGPINADITPKVQGY